MNEFTQDTLVQQTTAEYLEKQLGWESLYAYSNEGFGPDSLLGRKSDWEVGLPRRLRAKLVEVNPGRPQSAFATGHRCILPNLVNGEIVA